MTPDDLKAIRERAHWVCDRASQDVERLCDEVERLREALKGACNYLETANYIIEEEACGDIEDCRATAEAVAEWRALLGTAPDKGG